MLYGIVLLDYFSVCQLPVFHFSISKKSRENPAKIL